ncbi:MAG: hypothetical protein R3E97_14470 [Candidatus Eisenbacteria bacterium]
MCRLRLRSQTRGLGSSLLRVVFTALWALCLLAPFAFRAEAQTLSSPPELSFAPSEGFLILSSEEFVRLQVRSAADVRVRARWILKDEAVGIWGGVPPEEALETARRGAPAPRPDSRKAAGAADEASDWVLDEVWKPTSLEEATRDFVLSELPAPPSDAQGIYLEAESGGAARATSLLQFVSIGITAHMGTQSGLFWVTDLFHGEPLRGADLTLWDATRSRLPDGGNATKAARPADTEPGPIFRGVTDEDGLVWTPGTEVLAPAGRPTAARATLRGRSAWLPLSLPDPLSRPKDVPTEDAPVGADDVNTGEAGEPDAHESEAGVAADSTATARAVLFTDRDVYAPEDLVRWQLFSVLRRGSSLEWAAGTDWILHVDGPADVAAASPFAPPVPSRTYPIRANQSMEVRGDFTLPRQVGVYRLRLASPREETPVLERYVRVASAARPWLALTLEDDASDNSPLVGRCSVSSTGRVETEPGRSAGVVPLGWRVDTTLADAPFSAQFPDFHFSDAWNDALPIVELRRDAETNDDGEAEAVLTIARGQATSGCRIELRLHPRVLPDGGETRRSWTWYPSALVPGVRNAGRDRESIGALAWEWVVVDLSGRPVEGESVQLELRRIDAGHEALLWTRNGTSSDGPLRLAVERPGPGDYTLRVVLPDGTAAMPGSDAPSRAGDPNPSFLRANSSGSQLDLTLGGTPLAGANTLFVVERGDILAAKAERVPGDGTMVLPLPPLPPPTAELHVTQVGSDPSRVRYEGGLRNRLPFYRSVSAEVASDAPPHRALVVLSVDAGGQSPDSASVSIELRTPDGAHPAGNLSVSVTAVPDSAPDAGQDAAVQPDPLAAAFGDAGTPPRWTELRDRLVLSGGVDAETTPESSAPGSSTSESSAPGSSTSRSSSTGSSASPATEASSPATRDDSVGRAGNAGPVLDDDRHAHAERSLLWNPDVEIPANAGVRFALPLGPLGEDRLRVRVWARTPDVRFGYAETTVRPDAELRIRPADVPTLYAGDRIEWPCRITNDGGERWEGRLFAEVDGGTLLRAPDVVRIDAGSTWNGRIELEAPADEGEVVLVTRLEDGTANVVSSQTVRSTVLQPKVERTVVRSGVASPRAEDVLDLSDGHLLAAQGVEIRVAASYYLELGDAVRTLLSDTVPDPDRDIARLAAAALAARAPSWYGTTRDELSRVADESCARLQSVGIPLGEAFEIPETDLVPASRFRPFALDARARWAASLAAREGLPVPSAWQTELDAAADSYRTRIREIMARPQLEIAALHTFTDRVAGRQRPDDRDLIWLLARDTLLGTLGRTYLALAWDAETARPEILPQLRGQYETLLRDVGESLDPTRPSVLADGSVATSAMLLRLLAERAPNHQLAPALLRGVLGARNAAGIWPDRMNGALSVCGISALLSRVESVDRPQRAELVLGRSTTKDLLLEPAPPSSTDGGPTAGSTREVKNGSQGPVAIVEYDLPTLSRMRRHDPDGTKLELLLTTERASSAHYQIRTHEESPAARLAAATGAIRVTRVFRRVDGTPFGTKGADPIGWIDAGASRLLEVELTIELQESTAGLFIDEALPPASTFRGWIQDGASADPGLDRATVRSDHSIEFVTAPLSKGTHVFRYGLEVRSAGRFHLPGTRVEALRTGARGRGAGQELRLDR